MVRIIFDGIGRKVISAMREGVCIICGKSFVYDKGKKITCSNECAAQRNRIKNCEYKRKVRKKFRAEEQAYKPKPKKKKAKDNLDKDLIEARKLGMSYGIYKDVTKGGMAVERSGQDE